MTHTLHGRLGHILSSRARLLLSSLTFPLVLLAGCVTPPGTLPSTPVQAAPVADAPASVAAPQATASALLQEPEIAVAPVPVDPIRPEVRIDLDDRTAQIDLWV